MASDNTFPLFYAGAIQSKAMDVPKNSSAEDVLGMLEYIKKAGGIRVDTPKSSECLGAKLRVSIPNYIAGQSWHNFWFWKAIGLGEQLGHAQRGQCVAPKRSAADHQWRHTPHACPHQRKRAPSDAKLEHRILQLQASVEECISDVTALLHSSSGC
mmetsp:Transcript_44887/g.101048  ORF Transcript_44887/g.101048 Transcript_44887/m.101048 type:complete len:156 (+) Transcript_44887:939-1406(+)